MEISVSMIRICAPCTWKSYRGRINKTPLSPPALWHAMSGWLCLLHRHAEFFKRIILIERIILSQKPTWGPPSSQRVPDGEIKLMVLNFRRQTANFTSLCLGYGKYCSMQPQALHPSPPTIFSPRPRTNTMTLFTTAFKVASGVI